MSRRRSRKRLRKLRRRLIRGCVTAAVVIFFLLFFRLKTVYVRGSLHTAPSDVTAILLERPAAQNTLLTALFNRNRKLNREGFIDSLSVEILGRDTVRVLVSEKKFVGCVKYEGKFWYFDSAGTVGASSPSRTKGEPIPPVEGLELRADPELMGVLPIATTKILSMLGMLRASIDSNSMMIPDNVIFDGTQMTLIYGNITVLMGNGEKMEMRLKELEGILPELLSGYEGTLHLENYTGSSAGLIFDKK